MSTLAQRNSRASLDAARATVARLAPSTGAEDLAADLIETWTAVEAALRTLVGSTTLAGQGVIREARQRQMITFDLANTLAEFQAVFDRVHDTSYQPTDADIAAARNAFDKLDTALSTDAPAVDAPRILSTDSLAANPSATVQAAGLAQAHLGAPPRRFPLWIVALAGVFVLGAAVTGAYFAFRSRGTDSLEQGIDAYRRGQREVAVNAFNKAARDDAHAAMPHVYLARMARDVGNFTLSSQELQLALQAEPASAIALREMGANLLTQGNYELARRFYVRAAQANPTDTVALGYLGCTLIRLNRSAEGTTFLNRAGPGPWSSCTPTVPPTAAGVIPRE